MRPRRQGVIAALLFGCILAVGCDDVRSGARGQTPITPDKGDGGDLPDEKPEVTLVRPVANGVGSLTCSSIVMCKNNCPFADNACYSNCLSQGTTQDQNSFLSLFDCEMLSIDNACREECANNPLRQVCQRCIIRPCALVYDACHQGTGTCGQLLRCMSECPDEDLACKDLCYLQISSVGIVQYYDLLECGNLAYEGPCKPQCADDSSDECTQCVKNICSPKVDECMATL